MARDAGCKQSHLEVSQCHWKPEHRAEGRVQGNTVPTRKNWMGTLWTPWEWTEGSRKRTIPICGNPSMEGWLKSRDGGALDGYLRWLFPETPKEDCKGRVGNVRHPKRKEKSALIASYRGGGSQCLEDGARNCSCAFRNAHKYVHLPPPPSPNTETCGEYWFQKIYSAGWEYK